VIIPAGRRTLIAAVAAVSAITGTLVALHYHTLGLTLSHYDARGHLVVARRVIDSITPGWQQIGAVWLPLPHLLNFLPVQIDALYRTGASAVVISVISYAIATAAITWIIHTLTESRAAAVAGALVFAANPNVLYLQATPMTEPLLLALTISGVALLIEWTKGQTTVKGRSTIPAPLVGWVFALACLTRYEAWPVTAVALVAAAWTLWRAGETIAAALKPVAAIALFPAIAIGGFLVFSRIVIGEWFVSSGFFVPENKALHAPIAAAAEIWWGLHMLSGYAIVIVGAIGAGAMLVVGLTNRNRANGLIALALGATAALPWAAFVKGHPFRIRYMVPLIALQAVGAGVVASVMMRARLVLAIALIVLVAYELRPLDRTAPMVVEAQWDRPNVPVRRQVTACLGRLQPGAKIMASMGSLGHYMQEVSVSGLDVRDFLHEGNGDIWLAALASGPRPFAEWLLIEEKAEGGDMLAMRVRSDPRFLDGYSRVCEGAGLALYRRADRQNLTLIRNR
jgi:hypothetical protein